MSGRVGFAVVLLAGYLLGRTKKLKLALRVASAIGGKQFLSNRRGIVGRTTRVLDSPEAKLLVNQVGGTLVEAAEGALTTAASKRVRSLSENLQGRAEKLRAPHEGVGKARETVGKGPQAAGKASAPATEEPGMSPETAARSPRESSERSSGAGRPPRVQRLHGRAATRGPAPRGQALSGRQGGKPTSK